MITFENAYALVQEHAPTAHLEVIPVVDAWKRTLKEDIKAERPFPPFDRVAMDGIAIYSLTAKTFEVEDVQYAGQTQKSLKDKCKCLEVMTGSILPKKTRAVIRYEDLIKTENSFVLKPGARVAPYQNVHRRGSDAKKGDIVLVKNTRLSIPHISLLASLGKREVLVEAPFKVAILATGDELVTDVSAEQHQLYSSNVEAIFAILGPHAKIFHVGDDLPLICTKIKQGLQRNDILIISGGVSVGKKDLVPQALEKLKVKNIFHGVAQKPGKPFWFGKTSNGKLVFGLPGNPIAFLISFYIYILPILQKTDALWTILEEDIPSLSTNKVTFVLVKILDGKAYPIKTNGSSDLISLAKSDGFILPIQGKRAEVTRLWRW